MFVYLVWSLETQEVWKYVMKPKVAPCGKLIFSLAVYGVVWYPDKTTLKETAHLQQHGKMSKKKCVVFFMGWHELDNNTFSAQFPLNAVISHLRKTFQSPLSTVLLIDLLPGCQVLTLSWHVCSSLFITPMFVCVCVNVQQCLATRSGTSRIPQSPPKGPLRGPRPPRARSPRSVPGQLRRALRSRWELHTSHSYDNIDVFRCSWNSVFKTLWIRGLLLKVISL